MNTTEHNRRKPGRPRKDEVEAEDMRAPRSETTERRRKNREGGELFGKRLAVSKSMLDFSNYKYRWVNDEPGRIFAMTQEDDWDIMHNNGEKEDSADIGSRISQWVGTHPNGDPKMAYLCRKPKPFFDEDQKAKHEELDRQLANLKRGEAAKGGSQGDYIPHSGIKM